MSLAEARQPTAISPRSSRACAWWPRRQRPRRRQCTGASARKTLGPDRVSTQPTSRPATGDRALTAKQQRSLEAIPPDGSLSRPRCAARRQWAGACLRRLVRQRVAGSGRTARRGPAAEDDRRLRPAPSEPDHPGPHGRAGGGGRATGRRPTKPRTSRTACSGGSPAAARPRSTCVWWRAPSSDGDGAILLVPEIALTPQMIDRVRARFGSAVACCTAACRSGRARREYGRIAAGEGRVVVGARSAVFAPVRGSAADHRRRELTRLLQAGGGAPLSRRVPWPRLRLAERGGLLSRGAPLRRWRACGRAGGDACA